jgi:diguanylate cyclase (GGDEF)-like protein
MADTEAPQDPVLDIRVRWRAGQVLLGFAFLLALVALTRPLSAWSPAWLKAGSALALGLGVSASALLASLRGHKQPETIALHAFLVLSVDSLGQLVGAHGLPVWPLMALLVASLAVAEGLPLALGAAALATLLALAHALRPLLPPFVAGDTPGFDARGVVAATIGYFALALAINRALAGEKRRLSTTLAELARLKHGIDQLADDPDDAPSAPRTSAAEALRQVSDEGRRARQLDRASELDTALGRILDVALEATAAHAVLYFDLDRQRELAHLRVARGPAALVPDCAVPLGSDPFSFLVERGQTFYATDFKRLLHELPWYRGRVEVGTLLAVPVRVSDVILGTLVADQLEIQAFTGREPRLLAGIAELAAEAIRATRASLGREELDAEFKAVYPISQRLAMLAREGEVRELLLRSARHLAHLEGGAVVMSDDLETRYVVEAGFGWPAEFLKREVALDERTWSAWVLRSAEEAYLLESRSEESRMPVLVLDEPTGGAESLLAVPLRARGRTLGALVLTGARGTFDASSRRVLEILANQAAATIQLIKDKEQQRQLAVRDGLTGLYNRRAFGELLVAAIANEDRRPGGSLGLAILDLDHFKKLNDTYGHPAGDAALRSLARLLDQHLRKGDQAARYGGEEFVVILPGSDAERSFGAAERLRGALEKHRFVFEGARIPLSASLGLAVWPGDGREPEPLLAAADRALYAAKQAGRNRVVAAASLVASDAPETP